MDGVKTNLRLSRAPSSSEIPNAPSTFQHLYFKLFATSAFLLILPFELAWRTLTHFVYIPNLGISPRPHPSWSLQRDLLVATIRLHLAWTHRFCLPQPEGKKAWMKHRFTHRFCGPGTKVDVVTIPPAPLDTLTGMLVVAPDIVKPVEIPGFWCSDVKDIRPKDDYRAKQDEKVIVYIAGGSWAMGHPMGTPFPYQFCKATHKRVLSINYRKCLTAETAFPAPLQDALAGYLYLLGLGFEPQNITLIGDSSGAHILLGLTRYLAELHMEHMQDPEVGLGLGLGLEPGASHTQDDTTTTTTKLEHRSGGSGGSNGDHSVVRNLGVPGALLLISPSTNLSHPPNDTIPTCILSPYLNRRVYPSMARHYPPDALERNPYFSPASPAVTGESAALVYAQQHPQQRSQERRSRGCVEALEVGRGTGVDSVRMDVDIEKDGAGGDGFTSHNTDTNMNTNTRTGLRIYIQHGTAELITPDQDLFTAKLAQEGVVFEVDRVEGGCHLDAMMAFTCLEKKESSWVRLLDAVKKYTDDG